MILYENNLFLNDSHSIKMMTVDVDMEMHEKPRAATPTHPSPHNHLPLDSRKTTKTWTKSFYS